MVGLVTVTTCEPLIEGVVVELSIKTTRPVIKPCGAEVVITAGFVSLTKEIVPVFVEILDSYTVCATFKSASSF